ncbi:MAG: hypothetical protein Q7R80_00765 [bacterium]|nr:hypothetical protein [bacterium]
MSGEARSSVSSPRDWSDAVAPSVLAVICVAASVAYYQTGGPTKGWNAMLFLVSLGAWALLFKGVFHMTSHALLHREPEWPEQFCGLVGADVSASPAVARYWGTVLAIAAPITFALVIALGFLIATHTRANDGTNTVLVFPVLFAVMASVGICLEALLEYRRAKDGFTIERDEWDDGNGYVEGI